MIIKQNGKTNVAIDAIESYEKNQHTIAGKTGENGGVLKTFQGY